MIQKVVEVDIYGQIYNHSIFFTLIQNMNKRYIIVLNHLFWFVLSFTFIIIAETILVSLFTGYLPTRFSFLLWNNFHFLLDYLWDEPIEILSFLLIDKPLFKIDALQDNLSTVIWGLHFYSYTLLTHIFIAVLASRLIVKQTLTISALRSFPVSGSILLILSSLFLYLSSCCTNGATWIVHSLLLVIMFTPGNAIGNFFDIYNYIQGWLIWVQVVMAISGSYLVMQRKVEKGSAPFN
jgi:hypothetical protein